MMTATEYVVLVDEQNHEVGTAEKLVAHQQSLLHRAFSIFIFKKLGDEFQLLLQQRALHKYHSPGLWTNTCCSHPRQGETILSAGKRRLKEELGIEAELIDCGWFKYHAPFPNGLFEHEIDHVLVGEIDEETLIQPDAEEVHSIRWITIDALQQELSSYPEKFTPWLKQALSLVVIKPEQHTALKM